MIALITNIQGFSIHDGPGIRTVVFIKGCALACLWCANPEGISSNLQIGYIENLCQQCGACYTVCPTQAINIDAQKHRIDYDKCTYCGKCVQACLYNALVEYGEEMSVEEVFDAVRRDKMFYDTSGGGVTVSGGEPLLHTPFVKELFELCKNDDINTCIETSGYATQQNLLDVLPVTDYLLFDLKHMNPDIHMKYTGRSNDQILSNARLVAENGANVTFRIPLIPGVNDGDENIAQTAAFVKSLPGEYPVQLMPYHRLGDSKYKAMNIPNLMHGVQVMDEDALEAVKRAYISHGIDCTISK